MKKQTKLINEFYEEYCFSNKTIACHHLNIEKDVLEFLLSGKDSLEKWHINPSYVQHLINTLQPTTEIETLEEIIFHLSMMNKVLGEQYYIE
jgi:hypothetical protein